MWTARVGRYDAGAGCFIPRPGLLEPGKDVFYRAPRYADLLRFVRAYGDPGADYELIHVVGVPARFDKRIHILTGDAIRNNSGAFVF